MLYCTVVNNTVLWLTLSHATFCDSSTFTASKCIYINKIIIMTQQVLLMKATKYVVRSHKGCSCKHQPAEVTKVVPASTNQQKLQRLFLQAVLDGGSSLVKFQALRARGANILVQTNQQLASSGSNKGLAPHKSASIESLSEAVNSA